MKEQIHHEIYLPESRKKQFQYLALNDNIWYWVTVKENKEVKREPL
jgi:hypothetical protein